MSTWKPTLLLIGLGGLGGVILELLAREPRVGRIIGADCDVERGAARVNLARVGALAQGLEPDIEFLRLNLHEIAMVADAVGRLRPDVILSTASLQTWWLPDMLSAEAAAPIKRARFGAWLPVHLTLTLKLMQAIRQAGYGGLVLTAPFPDVVNVVLKRLDLAPSCGIGNVDEIVPKVRWLTAARLSVLPARVRVYLVAHHSLEPFVFGQPGGEVPPHFLRVERDGEDVSAAVDAESLLLARYPLRSGPSWHFLTAGSTVHLLTALASDEPVLVHVPAPQGLPGGYPVLAGRWSLAVPDIPGLSLTDAILLNERAHRFDGIDRIEADGTAVFCEDSVAALHESLGYNCPRLPPGDAEPRARELMARFEEYARRHGAEPARWARLFT